VLRQRPRLGLSVLAEGQDAVCQRLANKNGDRFAGTDWVSATDYSVFVEGATLWLDCTIHGEFTAGDHDIVLLDVHGLRADPKAPRSSFTVAASDALPSSDALTPVGSHDRLGCVGTKAERRGREYPIRTALSRYLKTVVV
jgi:flavin reductase (DIM6/NTAB) family NADH-FMN oxidoreductase RutF